MAKSSTSDFLIERGERKIQIRAMQGEKEAGHLSVLSPLHIEGAWIEPEFRGGTILRDLVMIAEAEIKQLGADRVFAFAIDEEKADYLERLGYEKHEWTVWSKKVKAVPYS